MTKEALELALKALEANYLLVNGTETHGGLEQCLDGYYSGCFDTDPINKQTEEAITAIKEALSEPEQDNTYIYASSLATAIWQKHYMKESPKFALLDTTEGVLTQIDNMTCGLVREKPAQPEQEPVAYIRVSKTGNVMACAKTGDFYKLPDKTLLYTSPTQRTWVGLTDDEALMTVALETIEGFIPYLPLDDTDQMARYDQAVKGLTKRLKDKKTRGQA